MQAKYNIADDSKKVKEIDDFIDSIKVPRIINKGFSTQAIHGATDLEKFEGSLSTPIYMAAPFAFKTNEEAYSSHMYGRISTPTSVAFEKVMAAVEHGKYAITYCTGIIPIYSLLALFNPGDHILLPFECYGGTRGIEKELLNKDKGYTIEYVKMEDIEEVKKAIKPETKFILMETPTNPKLYLTDIESVVTLAKEKGIVTAMDNTVATPYLMNPLDMGVDVVMHSYAKYIGGHSDLMGGVLVMNDEPLYKKLKYQSILMGSIASPFNDFLAIRGMKTLKLRVDTCCRSAYIIAHWLKEHRNVDLVYFPGLVDHPGHELAKKQMRGFGGMVAFEVKGDKEATKKVVDSFKLFTIAGSLGGVESLVHMTIYGTHKFFSAEEVAEFGIKNSLVRLSIGCEDVSDLLLDLDQALNF